MSQNIMLLIKASKFHDAKFAARALGKPKLITYLNTTLNTGHAWGTARETLILPVRAPGAAARALRAGANLAPDRAVGRRTWEEFLADQVGSGDHPAPASTPHPR